MDYLVNFNLRKNLNGVNTSELILITFKAKEVNSKLEAFRAAQRANSKYFQGEDKNYLVEDLQIQRVPEEAPVLDTNYFRLYKKIFLGLGARLNDEEELSLKSKDERQVILRKYIDKDGHKNVSVKVEDVDMSYDYESDLVTLVLHRSKFNNVVETYSEWTGHKNQALDDFDRYLRFYYYTPEDREKLQNFFNSFPMFSKKEIAKLQVPIQKIYEKEYLENQKRLIADDEEIERLLIEGSKSKKNYRVNKIPDEIK